LIANIVGLLTGKRYSGKEISQVEDLMFQYEDFYLQNGHNISLSTAIMDIEHSE
jgi:hypothetical protein